MVRIVDSSTRELIEQIPSQYILDLADQITQETLSNSGQPGRQVFMSNRLSAYMEAGGRSSSPAAPTKFSITYEGRVALEKLIVTQPGFLSKNTTAPFAGAGPFTIVKHAAGSMYDKAVFPTQCP